MRGFKEKDMIQLPDVTLVALTDQKIDEHKRALKKSSIGIEWGKVLLLSTENDSISWGNRDDETGFDHFYLHNKRIAPLKSIDSWNRSVIYEMPKFIETSHALLIHHDGYVTNPHLWNPEWLQYDYIGAPWPIPQDSYSYRDEERNIVRVGNSVSLRSKKLMDLVATRRMEYHYGNNNEDGQICCWNRKWLESQGCKFAPLEVAVHFSKEHIIEENKDIKETFAFHSL